MIDCFIKRMTVLGRGLVFQPVLVTQICTYNSNNIALQNIGITDFPSNNKKQKQTQTKFFLKRTYQFPPPPPTRPKKKKKKKSNKRSHDTNECFDVSLKLSKLHVKKKNDKGQNQMTIIIEST